MSQLTVITNAINIAAELAGTHIEVILTADVAQDSFFAGGSPGGANAAAIER